MNGPFLTYPGPYAPSRSVRASALVFEDPSSLVLLAQIERLAPSEANLLIIGETGTGKELVARHVHQLSPRRDQPFLAVNCGFWSEALIETELFGAEGVAFIGAVGAKKGWFEAANGGTLFLDEIGDLPLSMQAKLLRVLQERKVVRVGSTSSHTVDVRLLAGTDIGLKDAVAAGRFREDLFYQLRVASVLLPPLRDRPGDILPLTSFFLREHGRRFGYDGATLSEDATRALLRHSWPGNIRELENAIHRAVAACGSGVIRSDDLHLASVAGAADPEPAPALPNNASVVSGGLAFEEALATLFEAGGEGLLERIEDAIFRSAFEFCQRNQERTAALLGVGSDIVSARLVRVGETESKAEPEPRLVIGA